MGILDRIKHAVTGGAAKVELVKHTGNLAPGEMVYVKVSVEAVSAIDSDGVFIDLHGEDDPDEGMLDKAVEIFNPDPTFSWPLAAGFKLAAGETRVFENAIAMPVDLKIGDRIWLVRARVEVTGKDPTSPWVEFVKAE